MFWDLSFLGRNFEGKLKGSIKKATKFKQRYKGKLTEKNLKKALIEYEKICEIAEEAQCYSYLRFAETSLDPKRGQDLQLAQELGVKFSNEMLFFELEIPKVLKKKPKTFGRFNNYLSKVLDRAKHNLSEREEGIFSKKALTGAGALVRLFDEEWGAQKFIVQGKALSESEALNLLYDPNRNRRVAAHKAVTDALKEQSKRITLVFNTLALDKSINDQYRGFKNPEDSRHMANETDKNEVDSLIRAVSGSYKIVQDFYKLKAKLLKLKTLKDYDRYAPIGASRAKYSLREARKLVVGAFSDLSTDFGKLADRFFKDNWIDAENRKGKRSGAFCSFVTARTHPVVFINYHGSLRDVFTLAHELGHGIHAVKMKEAGSINFDTPLTIAETASVFAEMLLFNHIKVKLNKRELISMYVAKIENIIATVYRQTSMFQFERLLHQERKSGELSTERINFLWRSTQKQMFGKSVELTKEYDYWWGYIPHFVHTPFYVYAYAYGELLTLGLYEQFQKTGSSFVPKYEALLSAGASKTPNELLSPFAPNIEYFWKYGIKQIKILNDELIQLV